MYRMCITNFFLLTFLEYHKNAATATLCNFIRIRVYYFVCTVFIIQFPFFLHLMFCFCIAFILLCFHLWTYVVLLFGDLSLS